jgi:hypothetical protein
MVTEAEFWAEMRRHYLGLAALCDKWKMQSTQKTYTDGVSIITEVTVPTGSQQEVKTK